MFPSLRVMLLILCCDFVLFPPIAVSAAETPEAAANEEFEDFAPGVFVLLFIVLIIASGVILGAVVLAALGLLAVLTAVGIVSSSVLIGFLRKKPSAAFRAFFLQAGAAGGVASGIVLSLLIVWLFDLHVPPKQAFAVGTVCGGLGGFGIGVLFNLAWGRIVQRLTSHNDFTS